MPKEYTHFFLADKIFESLDMNSSIKAIVSKYRAVFLLGSIIPDTPLYYLFGKKRNNIQALSKSFHDHSNYELRAVNNLIVKSDNDDFEISLSLMLGVITHLIVDQIFHPFVNYYSGKDISRHFLIESYIDLYLKSKNENANWKYISKLISETNLKNHQILTLFGNLFDLKSIDQGRIHKALKLQSFAQRLFTMRPIRMVCRLFNFIPMIKIDAAISLFYPKLSDSANFFEGKFYFRDPYTGDESNVSLNELIAQMKNKTLEVFKIIQENFKCQQKLLDILNKTRLGKNSFNNKKIVNDEIKFFNVNNKIEKILFIKHNDS